jgi:TetR/AcrR family transcriptional repressor of nem operon
MARAKNFDENEVLHKILLLFMEKGYHQASLADILKAGGISKQSMYDTYGNKRALFLKAFILFREENSRTIMGLVQDEFNKGTLALEILRNMMFFGKIPNGKIKGCLMVASMIEFKEIDNEISSEIDKLLLSLTEIIRMIVNRGQLSGEITGRLPVDHITEVLLNARNGIQVSQHYDMPLKAIENVADWTIDLIRGK